MQRSQRARTTPAQHQLRPDAASPPAQAPAAKTSRGGRKSERKDKSARQKRKPSVSATAPTEASTGDRNEVDVNASDPAPLAAQAAPAAPATRLVSEVDPLDVPEDGASHAVLRLRARF